MRLSIGTHANVVLEELKKIICMAEDAVRALAERDRLEGRPNHHDEHPPTGGSHD